ncbi:alpha/beta fold hydrolase [Rugamonas sp. CCM 8940]|uniref:alpha/beta fold hydrolase n=1 Tax=Rugamonas sp. CCM 8940 TaxID=2765359 RepID=UPI0018F48A3A|nr:alpha/beta hydrolase [Rugamonas sp. CCM 8940]MBJ7312596.1 alpha/beta hydrolase [Rugamonas sp. CCM 8940]
MQCSPIRNLFIAASLLLAQSTTQAAAHPAFQVEVSGQGRPVILIPGLASAGQVWDGTVQHYCAQQQRQCHVLTLAGFAGVPAIDTPLLASVEQQLSDYIREQGLVQPLVIGHSLGGFLGLKLASDHPEQVGRLVVVDVLPALGALQVPSMSAEQLRQMASGMRENMLRQEPAAFRASQMQSLRSMVSQPADVERIAGWGQRSDRNSVIDAMAQMLGDDMRQDIARIKAPTLVLGTWIAYRDYAPKAAVEATFRQQYQRLAGVTIELSDNARHFIMYDDPAWLYDRVDHFIK